MPNAALLLSSASCRCGSMISNGGRGAKDYVRSGHMTSAKSLGHGQVPGSRNYFSHCSSGPPVHFTHQTLTISSFGYLLWRNKRHCYPFSYSQKKKVSKMIWNSHPENKQCNAVLHVALPTAPRAVDGSKGGLTNLYLGLNHPRWIGCMQMSTRGLWLAVCKWVRTGVRNCSGINNLAPGSLVLDALSCFLNLILDNNK